jgi:hypothetical protein
MDHDAIMGKIKVKYGISVSITIENVNKWLELTNKKIQDGIVPEQAGVESAKEVFININEVIYNSKSQSIENILSAIIKK